MALSNEQCKWTGFGLTEVFTLTCVVVLVRKRLVVRIKNLIPADQIRCETGTSYKSCINRMFGIINTRLPARND